MKKNSNRFEALGSLFIPAIVYSSISFIIIYFSWPYFYYVKSETIIAIGIIGIWRYGLLMINYIRAFIYAYVVYPAMKKKAFSKPLLEQFPKHIYFCIPSYKEEGWVSIEAFESIFSELSNIPSSVTMVISIANQKDEDFIRDIYHAHPFAQEIELVIQYQKDGKRIAMGHALRTIARYVNDRLDYDSITVLMDGDSYLTTGSLKKSIPLLYTQSKVGAVTTDEIAYIDSTSNWYKDWFNLKFGQRHILFQSQSLSKKVLTLTGRFSLFKTDIIIKEDFISKLENDILVDKNFGTFRFLMGDDKTTWFYLLKQGYDMLYLPDIKIYSLESRGGSFLEVSKSLPYRWYGNTLRNNYRARQLNNLPFFIRYLLLDQIFLMWTALVGIVGVVFLSIFVNYIYMPIYIAWVLFVRVFQMFVITLGGHRVSLRTVPLMLYNQWIGAFIKIKAYYHLYNQRYSKGNDTSQNADDSIEFTFEKFVPIFSNYRMYFAMVVFLFFILMLDSRILKMPSTEILSSFLEKENVYYAECNNSIELNKLIKNSKDNTTIFLPKGFFHIYNPIIINRSNITLDGKNTTIISHLKTGDEAVIIVKGKKGRKSSFSKTKTSLFNATTVELDTYKKLQNNTLLLIEQENDENFVKNILKSEIWYEKYPRLRSEIVKVLSQNEKLLYLQYRSTSYIDSGAKVYKLEPIKNIHLKNITIDSKKKVTNKNYINSEIDYLVDGIKFLYVSDSSLENINIYNSGSNPLSFDRCYGLNGKNIIIDKSHNKGKNGNGYLRMNKSFHIYLKNVNVKNIRHIVFQWSSAYNTIENLYTEVDINFHGGASHDNEVLDVTFNLSKTHLWSKIYYTPKDASWAPPDLDNNIVKEHL